MYRILFVLVLLTTTAAAAQTPARDVLRFDFPAVRIGVAANEDGPTGTTVFHFPEPVKGAIDVRGGSPGTVNASVLQNSSEEAMIDAVVFSGGSWYGLSAATGVANAIKRLKARQGERDYIAGVVGAIIYDVGARRFTRVTPDDSLGASALRAAEPGRFPLGAQGAGRFTMQGWYFGRYYHTGGAPDMPAAVHSGQGGAFRQIGPTKVAVFTVVNALGAVVDREGRMVRCHRNDPDAECPLIADRFGQSVAETTQHAGSAEGPTPNTTITLVVTNQRLDFAVLRRLAVQVHTSMGRAIQPFATEHDGDVLVAVTTDEVDNPALSAMDLGVIASELAWDAVLSSVPELPVPPRPAGGEPGSTGREHGGDGSAIDAAAVGTYEFPGGSRLALSVEEGDLTARFTGANNIYFEDGRTYALRPAEDGRFVVVGPQEDVIRIDSRDGTVTGLTLNPGPWAQHARRIR